MSNPFTVFTIDYGDTIAFSILDSEEDLLLAGQTLVDSIALDQLELYLQTYNNKFVSIERQIGRTEDRYTNFIFEVDIKCKSFSTYLIVVNPSTWKNSPSIRFRPSLGKHVLECVKIGHYTIHNRVQ